MKREIGDRRSKIGSPSVSWVLSVLCCALALSCARAVPPPAPPESAGSGPITPIKSGKLTSDLDANEKNIIKGAYFNFGSLSGFSGYGLRDNAGVMEFKNSAGTWATIGSGGVVGGGTVTSIGITPDTGGNAGITVSGSPITTSGSITLGIDWTTIGPQAVTVSSGNTTTTNRHTHAVTASSNPGAAASLLKSDPDGSLQLTQIKLGSSTAGFSGTGSIINPLSGDSVRNTTYSSGVSGWNISNSGNAEFNDILARGEFRASVFKVNEIAATAGTFGVFYSAASLNSNATTANALNGSFTFDAKNSDEGASLFAVNDVVRLKGFNGSGIADAWAIITAKADHSTYETYTATLKSGSTSTSFKAGTAVVDYGPSGTGYITLSADGTVGSSPNLTMATHAGSPWSAQTLLLRLGNLNGSYDYATDVYGLGIGSFGESWFTSDSTNGIRIGRDGNVVLTLDTSGIWFIADSSITPTSTLAWLDGVGGHQTGRAYNYQSVSGGDKFSFSGFEGLAPSDSGAGFAESFLTARSPTVAASMIVHANTVTNALSNGAYINAVAANGMLVSSSTGVPTHMLEVSGTGKFTGLVGVGGSTPASAGATCEQGTITWDSSYIYVCISTNTWKRSAISTW